MHCTSEWTCSKLNKNKEWINYKPTFRISISHAIISAYKSTQTKVKMTSKHKQEQKIVMFQWSIYYIFIYISIYISLQIMNIWHYIHPHYRYDIQEMKIVLAKQLPVFFFFFICLVIIELFHIPSWRKCLYPSVSTSRTWIPKSPLWNISHRGGCKVKSRQTVTPEVETHVLKWQTKCCTWSGEMGGRDGLRAANLMKEMRLCDFTVR